MPEQVTLTFGYNSDADNQEATDVCVVVLARLFGGATVQAPQRGVWIDDTGKAVYDTVTTITATKLDGRVDDQEYAALLDICQRVNSICAQECTFLSVTPVRVASLVYGKLTA